MFTKVIDSVYFHLIQVVHAASNEIELDRA